VPIYEFQCPKGKITEKLVEIDKKNIECPKRHKLAARILSACSFRLKGGGWSADGYSSKKKD
jgi:putative FmdB family regulatory protein